MTSLLTNAGTMTALETLRALDRARDGVSRQVATGKQVADARDNAAVWAIAAVMRTDVSAFKTVTGSLSLAAATVAVARGGAEAVAETLDMIKARVIGAQAENVDLAKIDAEVQTLIAQVRSIVDSAQFNGLNLLKSGDPDPIEVVAALNRAATGFTASYIEVPRANLTFGDDPPATPPEPVDSVVLLGGNGIGTSTTTTIGVVEPFEFDAALLRRGDVIDYAIDGAPTRYVIGPADLDPTGAIDADRLANNFIAAVAPVGYTLTNTFSSGAPDVIGLTHAGPLATVSFSFSRPAADASALAALDWLSVATPEMAALALDAIEPTLGAVIDAAARLGAKQRRLDSQSETVQRIADALTSGVGALVDADMEAASARLQAVEVQRELGLQALTIANASAQRLLSLFR